MARGDYDAIIKNRIYTDSNKVWNIELLQSDMVWYDLVVNEHEIFPLKDLIKKRFKSLNNLVKENLEKRFVYFIASRKRVRFSLIKKPKYSLSGKYLCLFLEVGKERKIKKLKLLVDFESSKRPKVEVTDKFITFVEISGNKYTISVHDFLLDNQINLGIDTYVQYVGKTKIPERRPLDGSHSGLNKILYSLSNEENDIFIFYNLFKIMVFAKNDEFNAEFIVPNSMTDEIDVEKEGDILEKSLILHFSSENQMKNIGKEIGELKNSLAMIAVDNHINKITMGYEVDDISEYYRFGSSSIIPKHNHTFCFSVENGILQKEELDRIFE